MRNSLRSLFCLGVACLAAACSRSRSITEPQVYTQVELADSVKIRVNETVIVEGIRIRLLGVPSDSRCAIDVVCIWAGDAVASLGVEMNCDCRVAPVSLDLHTSLEPKAGDAFGYRVRLLAITPAPRSLVDINPDAYVAHVRVTKTD
jgi:hypothetical protein